MKETEIKDIFCKPGDERALLSYAFRDIDFYYDMTTKVSSTDFLRPEHSLLFMVLGVLQQKNAGKFDLQLVINSAQAQGVLETIGGLEYIQSIASMDVSNSNYSVFLNNVLESSTKCRLYKDLTDNLSEIVDNAKEGYDSSELLSRVESNVLDLSTLSKAVREPINVSENLREWVENRRTSPVETSGLDTGFPILNKQIDGLIPGTLFVISARKKMGKSAFLTCMATHIAYRLSKPVLYVDTELSFEEWRPRVLASMSGVEERKIKHGGYSDEEYDKIMKCVEIIEKGKFFHEYMPGYSLEKLVSLYKKYKLKEDIAVGIFDYIKEPQSTNETQRRKEYQVLGDVTTALKDLAGNLNIPFVTAVQINREGSVADSDRIARYADVIAQWMTRTKEEIEHTSLEEAGAYKLVIRDTRRGGATPEEGICYKFYKPYLRIKETPAHRQLLKDMFTNKDVVNRDTDSFVEGADDELR
jgi:replicative DNA helicase